MLATQFSDFGKGEPFRAEWGEFLGDSIFTTDGAQWHSSRQLLRPQFSKDRISDLHCFEDHFQTLVKAIANGGPMDGEEQTIDLEKANGRTMDISDLFFRFTLDVTTDFLLGADTKSLCSLENDFANAFNGVQHFQNVLARTGNLRSIVPRYRMRRQLAVVESFINFYIDRALRLTPDELAVHTKSDEGYTFLHELASATRDRKRIRDQIMAILLAGRDTTASTMSWVIYELSKKPEMVKKLRAEIAEMVGGEEVLPTYEHLKNMPYLKAILNETLRLYPVVPFNVRLALLDTTLPRGGGPDGTEPLPVLKDTPCAYSTLCMQRDPSQYPEVSEDFADPAEFSPERWAKWHPKPHNYIPFNAGPRICIGQQFALTEMSYVMVRLFQKFSSVTSHMDEIDGGNPLLKADIVLSPGQGVKVSFHQDDEKSR
jgi:cytochrome P450